MEVSIASAEAAIAQSREAVETSMEAPITVGESGFRGSFYGRNGSTGSSVLAVEASRHSLKVVEVN